MCQGKIHLVSVWCCLNAVSQHLKGQEIYLLPIWLFLFYPIKTAVLLSPLLSHSYWDPERTLHHVPVSPHPFPSENTNLPRVTSGMLFAAWEGWRFDFKALASSYCPCSIALSRRKRFHTPMVDRTRHHLFIVESWRLMLGLWKSIFFLLLFSL